MASDADQTSHLADTPRKRIIEGTMRQLSLVAQGTAEWDGLVAKVLAEAVPELTKEPWQSAMDEVHRDWNWETGKPAQPGMRWEEYRVIVLALSREGVIDAPPIPTDNKARATYAALNKFWTTRQLDPDQAPKPEATP